MDVKIFGYRKRKNFFLTKSAEKAEKHETMHLPLLAYTTLGQADDEGCGVYLSDMPGCENAKYAINEQMSKTKKNGSLAY